MRMTGKTVFLTGGASGLGAATARRMAREGASVALADLDLAAAQRVAAEIAGAGGSAIALQADVTQSDSLAAAVAGTVARFGRLDTVVAAAGITINGDPVSMAEADWDRLMDINLKGVFLTCKHALPEIERAGGGAVVLFGSITSFTGRSLSCAYAASKSALLSFSRNVALKYARLPIRVNVLCPGHCETPLVARLFEQTPGTRERLLDLYPMGRFAREDEIANAALFLASDEASYITGTELVIDGGFLAQ
ncbi:short chain dehydrogenase (plasmid) [Paracoccus aminovorans]|nr:short chain dehydrogenase [Paracoccus aminovorans]